MHAYIHTYTYSCIHTYIYSYIHTYIHTYIPWIRKCVIKTARCGTCHKYVYTSLQSTILHNILRKYYKSSLHIKNLYKQ